MASRSARLPPAAEADLAEVAEAAAEAAGPVGVAVAAVVDRVEVARGVAPGAAPQRGHR